MQPKSEAAQEAANDEAITRLLDPAPHTGQWKYSFPYRDRAEYMRNYRKARRNDPAFKRYKAKWMADYRARRKLREEQARTNESSKTTNQTTENSNPHPHKSQTQP